MYILCAALEHLVTLFFFPPLDSMPLFNMENPFVYFTGYWVDKYTNYLEAHWPLFFPHSEHQHICTSARLRKISEPRKPQHRGETEVS